MKYYSGIDLGARKSQICIIDENTNVLFNKKMNNDLADFTRILELYRETLTVAVESTFNWYWLVDGLKESNFDVRLAHTLGLFMISRAKIKTDKRDALQLAKLLKGGMIQESYIYPAELRPVRDLCRKRTKIVNMRSSEYIGIHKILHQNGIFDYGRESVKRITKKDADAFFEHPVVKLSIEQALDRIRLCNKQIDRIEKVIIESISGFSGINLLMTIPGIGKILSAVIILEIGELKRFKSSRHFISYCRLVPGVAQSGDSHRRGRGSKQGNPYLKWAFTQASIYAVRFNPKIRKCFNRHLKRHKGRAGKIITHNIIARKLATAAYHVLQKHTTSEIVKIGSKSAQIFGQSNFSSIAVSQIENKPLAIGKLHIHVIQQQQQPFLSDLVLFSVESLQFN